jgi:DNA polymerase III alpha subunit
MEFIPNYIDRKHGKEPVMYMHDELKNILIRKY